MHFPSILCVTLAFLHLALDATLTAFSSFISSLLLLRHCSLFKDCGDLGNRLPPPLIVDKLLLLAQQRGVGLQIHQSASTSTTDAVHDIVRYLSLALGLLSMQRDRSEVLLASATGNMSQHEAKREVELEGERESTEDAGKDHIMDLAIAYRQLRRLWAVALGVQESLWLNIIACSYGEREKGDREHKGEGEGEDGALCSNSEGSLMSTSVFGLLASECRASAEDGLLRSDMIPSSPNQGDKEGEEDDDGGVGAGDGRADEDPQGGLISLKSVIMCCDFINSSDIPRTQRLVNDCMMLRERY